MFFRHNDHSNFDVSLQELAKYRTELLAAIQQHHGETVFNHYKKQMEDIVDDLFAAIKNIYQQIALIQSGQYETYDINIASQEDLNARIKSVINLCGNNAQAKSVTEAVNIHFVNVKKYLQDLVPEITQETQRLNPMD
jgi:hypothetical protein